MMKLGLVSAILPDLSLEEVLKFLAEHDYSAVELMCWPVGKAERRYAGVTHVDVVDFSPKTMLSKLRKLLQHPALKLVV